MSQPTINCLHHPECKRTFRRVCDLNHHLHDVHTPSSQTRIYLCPQEGCNRAEVGFKYLAALKIHINAKHSSGTETEWYNCPVDDCAKRYKDPSSLSRHVRVKHPERKRRKYTKNQPAEDGLVDQYDAAADTSGSSVDGGVDDGLLKPPDDALTSVHQSSSLDDPGRPSSSGACSLDALAMTGLLSDASNLFLDLPKGDDHALEELLNEFLKQAT